ncbi:MAG: hypothetical protein HY799_06770 [Nitrosomonadales bacterium]|nr:hypothetical protein [Nitrosomonadales bacterium]
METQQAISQERDTKSDKQKAGDKSAFAMFVSIMSVITAVCSLWLSIESNRDSERVARVNAYMQLRESFNRVAAAIPGKYYDVNAAVPEKGTDDRRAIQNYWYLTFDEWYVTTQLNDRAFQMLWDDRFQEVIGAMLEKPVPRAVVCNLINEKFSQNHLQNEYAKVLDDLYINSEKHQGEHLCKK